MRREERNVSRLPEGKSDHAFDSAPTYESGEQRCGNCRFVLFDGCHRFPPFEGSALGRPVFPTVEPDEWCGEWRWVGTASAEVRG